jgi:hypothetical protein
MTGVAVEQMLELWCVDLRQVKTHLNFLFARKPERRGPSGALSHHPDLAAKRAIPIRHYINFSRMNWWSGKGRSQG